MAATVRPRLRRWRAIALHGLVLATGATVLQLIDLSPMPAFRSGELSVALVAGLFLAGGVVLGIRWATPPVPPPTGNPDAVAALGLSARELEVLRALAEGLPNKGIARRLEVSPNTVKTHLSRLFAKLEASNRVDAIRRARDLGILD